LEYRETLVAEVSPRRAAQDAGEGERRGRESDGEVGTFGAGGQRDRDVDGIRILCPAEGPHFVVWFWSRFWLLDRNRFGGLASSETGSQSKLRDLLLSFSLRLLLRGLLLLHSFVGGRRPERLFRENDPSLA
jgi:hypothetical protein